MNTSNIYSIEKIIHHSLDIEQSMYLLMELMAEKEHLLPVSGTDDTPKEIIWKKRDSIYNLTILYTARFHTGGHMFITAKIEPDHSAGLLSQKELQSIDYTLSTIKETLDGLERDFNQLSKTFIHKAEKDIQAKDSNDWLQAVKKDLSRRYFGILLNQKTAVTVNRLILLSVITCSLVIFILSAVSEGSLMLFNTDTAIRYGASLNTLVEQGAYYRLLTGPFFHFGFLHLLTNVLYFGLLSYYLSDKYGSLFLLLFLFCAAFLPFAVEYAFLTDRIQASGGISSMVTACLGLFVIRATSGYGFGWKGWMAALAGLVLFLLITGWMSENDSNDGLLVSHTGHIAGAATGVLFGLIVHRIFVRNYFNQHLLTGAIMASLICLSLGYICIQRGNQGDIHKAVKMMKNALAVQDSVINAVIAYNDSSETARKEINLQSARDIKNTSLALDTIYQLKVASIIHQKNRKIQECLSHDRQYYLTYAAYFSGDSTITDEVFSKVTAERDAVWAGLEW